MEDYKAQYYNEALLHYGVKGMRWGVRRKRAAAAVKNAAKTYGKYQKERLKTLGNSYMHPIKTNQAISRNMKNDKIRTKLRKTLYRTGNEYKSINKDVEKSVRDSRINRVNKKITKLQKKKNGQVLQIARELYKNGRVSFTSHNNVVRTARKINSNKTKLASIKRGDSRKVTRLKVKRQPLKDYVSVAESRIYLNPPPQSDIKKYKKAKKSLRRIDQKINKQYKKKR